MIVFPSDSFKSLKRNRNMGGRSFNITSGAFEGTLQDSYMGD